MRAIAQVLGDNFSNRSAAAPSTHKRELKTLQVRETHCMRTIVVAAVVNTLLISLSMAERIAQVDQASRSSSNGTDQRRVTTEEVIVTAQKRAENLQEVPISISVLSGEQLDSSRAEGITEALSRVPGVSMQKGHQGGGTQLSIRGITTTGLFGGASPIGYYLDTIPFGFTYHAIVPDANAYDLERVEVLRGPQGTLYGAGGMGGVVRVLTHDAELDAFDFKARTSASSTKDGGENYRGDLAINMPIIQDRLGVRMVAGYNEQGGWIEAPSKNDINDAELANIRFKINAQPTDNLKVEASSWLSRSDYDALAISNDDGQFNSDNLQPTSADFDAYGLSFDYQFPSFSLMSSTGYLDFDNSTKQDLFFLFDDLLQTTNLESRVFSEEVTLTSTNSGSLWDWSTGFIFRDIESRTFQPFGGAFEGLVNQDLVSTSESYAFFGELHRWLLPDRLRLTAGLRYYAEDATLGGEVFGAPAPPQRASWNALTPRAVLAWLPDNDLTVYASYAQGFRSGILTLQEFPPAKPDRVHNYEIGAKGSVLGGRINFDSAFYYTDWKDIQQNLFVICQDSTLPCSTVTNAGSASGLGVDLGVSVVPISGLTLGLSLGWNDLTYDRDVVGASGLVEYKGGARIRNSPETTLNAFGEYVFQIGGTGFQGRLSGSANYTSERIMFSPLRPFESSLATSEPIFIGSASFTIEAPNHWDITLFSENVNNERDAIYEGIIPAWSPRPQPRTIGLQLEYRY